MDKYLLIRHEWWMEHKRWSHKVVEVSSQRDLDKEIALYEKEVSTQFNHATCLAIKIGDIDVNQK